MLDDRPAGERSLYDRALDLVCRATVLVTGVSLVVLTVIFGWLVYGRYVLNSTPTWVEQVSLLLVALITFLGAAVGIHENTHLGVSYFREMSPAPVRKVFSFVAHVVMGLFGGVMAVQGYRLTVFKWGAEIPLLHVPEGLRAIPITVCGVFIALFSIGHLIHLIRGVEEHSSLVD